MWRAVLCIALLFFASAAANAERQLGFPGTTPDKRTHRHQTQADEAYNAGDFKRAMFIYRTDLAPAGDKYAQYMVGYMYLNGESVSKDVVRAAAWYALAAERGHEGLVEASVALQKTLSLAQKQSALGLSLSLKQEFGDRHLVEKLIRRDMDRLRSQTGSRTQNCGQSVRVYGVQEGRSSTSLATYCQVLEQRIDKRTQYLAGYVEYGDFEVVRDEHDDPQPPAGDKD